MSYTLFIVLLLAAVFVGWKLRETVERRRRAARTNRPGSVLFR